MDDRFDELEDYSLNEEIDETSETSETEDNLDAELEEAEIEGYDDDLPNKEDEEEVELEDDMDIMFKFQTNNHKIEGKHALKRDTIFKGKLDDGEDLEYNFYTSPVSSDDYSPNDGFVLESGSLYEFETKFNDEYISNLELSKDVYDLLSERTDLDFSSNRRKPNRQAFNDYYRLLLNELGKKYTKSEIFVELSYYFTDNIFNMFKLLEKDYATFIIIELKQSGYLDNLNSINFI